MSGRTIFDRLDAACKRYPIDEELVFGLDVGIASIGSAAVRHGAEPAILFCGSRGFDAPENPKDRKLNNAVRREARLHRRNLQRRASRMKRLRELLHQHGFLATTDAKAFHNRQGAPDPWTARATGLQDRLPDDELAAALLHIAKHRGFRSTSKSDAGENAPDDNKKMLKAMAETQEVLQSYGSLAQMMLEDPRFRERKRNRSGEYSRTPKRADLEQEVRDIFRTQRRLGNVRASEELEAGFADIAFFQMGQKGSEELVGFCPFEPEEKRSPRHAPSFEKFRLLARLNTVQVRTADGLRRLTSDELHRAIADWGMGTKGLTWKALAKKLGFADGTVFTGVDTEKAKKDVAAANGAMEGSVLLYSLLPTASLEALKARPEVLDEVAKIIAFREDVTLIGEGLAAIDGLAPELADALMAGVESGHFGRFSKTGHISCLAARRIIPFLLQGMVYSEACAAAGYDHTTERRIEITDIANPVVRRSLSEAVKQTVTLVHHFGVRPGRIIVEMAREVGKSADERAKMTSGLEKRTKQKQKAREELKQLLEMASDPSDENLRRYELWKEQNERCIYSDKHISATLLLTDAVEVDHALPRSRSHDNSFQNQVVCLTGENRNKGNRTPWEWFGRTDPARWEAFVVRVGALKQMKPYKRRLLVNRTFDERESGFVARNMNDTRYASRALLAGLRVLYRDGNEPEPAAVGYLQMGEAKRRLFARPGAITAILRRAWGLGDIKDREDDRHHGLDALICAAARSDWLLQRLMAEYKLLEKEERKGWVPRVAAPWTGFRNDALAAYGDIFVSRSERRRGRGAGHEATVRAIAETPEGTHTVQERKPVDKLTARDLERIPDADGRNAPLVAALAAWIDAGKPADSPPRSPKGDPIRKVRLNTGDRSGFGVNGGHVDNGEMVRVDVFTRPDAKGRERYWLVPIYRHQVMDRQKWPNPPDRAVTGGKPEADWPIVDGSFRFRFSLFKDSYVVAVKGNVRKEGYFRSVDRFTGALSLSPHNLRGSLIRGIGARTLDRLQKFAVDRKGCLAEIRREQRTWHGADCT